MVHKYNARSLSEEYIDFDNRRIIIWGRSVSGLEAYIFLAAKHAQIIGFTDSYATSGEFFAGLPVYSYEQLSKEKNITIFVSTINPKNLKDILAITDDLRNAEVIVKQNVYGPGKYDTIKLKKAITDNKEKIEFVEDNLQDSLSLKTFKNLVEYRYTNNKDLLEEIFEQKHLQYFPKEFMSFTDNEIFIDAGAYNGETSWRFSEMVGGKYNKIYLLEPDKRLINVVKEYVKIKGLHNAEIICKGAYSCSTKVCFNDSDFESGSSNINCSGDEYIETISIDELLTGKEATFIKMDIEGAEREALAGCCNTITNYHPKLAISIYHLEDDLWEIPYDLMQKYPFYKFYIRHYTDITTETVLYAFE
jgi:FkbM family methyltransferase